MRVVGVSFPRPIGDFRLRDTDSRDQGVARIFPSKFAEFTEFADHLCYVKRR